MHDILTFILAGIVAFAVIMYVILDGFDLGVGIMYGWINDEKQRHVMMSSVLPVWDGNETWLVLGGAALYGAFPIAYSTLLPELYLPVILMLAALIFRGVSFEFIHASYKSRFLWSFFFTVGSTVAAFCQGIVLGTFITGYTDNGALISSGDYQWLTPFSICCGIAVVFGYALLGSTWLIAKTEGALQTLMYSLAQKFLIITAFFMLCVTLWTPYIHPAVTSRWFSTPNIYYLSLFPILTFTCYVAAWRSLKAKREFWPFYLSIGLFVLAYLGFAVSVWPYIIPYTVTIWDAAAPLLAQKFILIGFTLLLPVLVAYTLYSYYVFKGKVRETEAGPHY